jgi:hypothetical protein
VNDPVLVAGEEAGVTLPPSSNANATSLLAQSVDEGCSM